MNPAQMQARSEYKTRVKPYNKRLRQMLTWKSEYIMRACETETQELEKASDRWALEAGRRARDLEHPPTYYEEALLAHKAAIKRAEMHTDPAESAARHWHFEITQPIWEAYMTRLEELK